MSEPRKETSFLESHLSDPVSIDVRMVHEMRARIAEAVDEGRLCDDHADDVLMALGIDREMPAEGTVILHA